MEPKNIKKIGVLTSGGDAPGMNAAIRAVVMTAAAQGIEVIGFKHGFNGIFDREFQCLVPKDVHHIIQQGGTLLKSARCQQLLQAAGPKLAGTELNALGIDALIVIGGDGSFRGCQAIAPYFHGQIVGIPGTIDNDVDGTDFTIGFATALDTALDAIDKIRDTADAFERIFLVELMGRHSGYIALSAGIAAGAEQIICPEFGRLQPGDLRSVITPIQHAQLLLGKSSYIIVVAENSYPGGTTALADELSKAIGIECRACILGHIQRGGTPVAYDRYLATLFGVKAFELVEKGEFGKMVSFKNNDFVAVDLKDATAEYKAVDVNSFAIKAAKSIDISFGD